MLSWRSENSFLSICSQGSVLSIGSIGSIASIGSIGSILSVGSIGLLDVSDVDALRPEQLLDPEPAEQRLHPQSSR